LRLLRDTVGGLPRTFWAIFAALLVNRFGATTSSSGRSTWERLGVRHWVLCGLLGVGAAAGHLASARTREQQASARELVYQT
jgi:hypothetical protein